MIETRYERVRELMEAELGDELVALDPGAGECFGFNGVATSVWRLLATPASFAEIRDSLLTDYDVEPEQCSLELKALLDDLTQRGLIRPRKD